jgi:PAS domain S-box
MTTQYLSLLSDLAFWKDNKIFDVLPVPVAILDTEKEIIYANKRFTHTFGPWEKLKCWEAYHKTQELCKHKSCARTFEKQIPIVSKGDGVTQSGQSIHYTKYSLPLMDPSGVVSHILELCIDNTSTDILRHEYQSLFDLVPCCIVIIDKNLRIIDANRMARSIYGPMEGRHCFMALKKQNTICTDCIARKAFATKKPQQGQQFWGTPEGDICNYQITAVPIEDEKGEVTAIMEMAVDITELTYLRDQSYFKSLVLSSIVQNSQRGLALITEDNEIPVLNPSLLDLFDFPAIGISDPEELYSRLPDKVNEAIKGGKEFYFQELELFPERGDGAIPVIMRGTYLKASSRVLGLLLSFQDLRVIKRLEKARVEAERMAAVGHTVAGLAHGVKNLVTALEGGMYMLSSGMQAGKAERIAQGMDMLDRNITRIGGFVKNFLNFARGREIKAKMNDPVTVAAEVVEQHKIKAEQNGIKLAFSAQAAIAQASIDYEGMHEALTNLVNNAIDACTQTVEGKRCSIEVLVSETDGVIRYDVKDSGCGMDAETKRKVFSNFFTTKGESGTGIGLLMTKKIIQEHGGTIKLESKVGKGTTFTILLPREHLPKPVKTGKP